MLSSVEMQAHLLLLAYLERHDDIPALLRQDLNYVLQKSPLLLEEMIKISFAPKPPHGYGWLVSGQLGFIRSHFTITALVELLELERLEFAIQRIRADCAALLMDGP
jgi:hypothetical protein